MGFPIGERFEQGEADGGAADDGSNRLDVEVGSDGFGSVRCQTELVLEEFVDHRPSEIRERIEIPREYAEE